MDTYIGPTSFFTGGSTVIGDLVLSDFGWGGFDRTFEHFFAYGHLPDGQLLDAARNLASNDLPGWKEHHDTVFQHWVTTTLEVHEYPQCFRRFERHRDLDDEFYTSHRVNELNITVLRHESWPLISSPRLSDRRETEYAVRRFVDWHRGARQLGRPATPSDVEIDQTPGYTVVGVPPGGLDELCLEWPSASFEEAMVSILRHEANGATNLSLVGDGCGLDLEQLKGDAGTIIRYGIRKHGPDTPFHNFLQWYEVGGPSEDTHS